MPNLRSLSSLFFLPFNLFFFSQFLRPLHFNLTLHFSDARRESRLILTVKCLFTFDEASSTSPNVYPSLVVQIF